MNQSRNTLSKKKDSEHVSHSKESEHKSELQKKNIAFYMFIVRVALVAQAIFGFLSLIWTLIQLDSLGPWNIAISESDLF